jgi:hypothetical protein
LGEEMMKTITIFVAIIVLASGCSKAPPNKVQSRDSTSTVLPPRLDEYFRQYCDYTGSLGIGFCADHTYDYRFRQYLKKTEDPEVKRLYVLHHLHQSLDWAIRDFEKGIVMTGKTSSRPLTPEEWKETKHRLLGKIDDLSVYVAFTNHATSATDIFDQLDPDMDQEWIEEKRKKIEAVKLQK